MDIVGANLYDRFIKRKDSNANAVDLPVSRLIPQSDELNKQTVDECLSMLVGTGVYKHKADDQTTGETTDVYHGHRDIAHEPELTKPHKFVQDVNDGIDYIFKKEGIEVN